MVDVSRRSWWLVQLLVIAISAAAAAGFVTAPLRTTTSAQMPRGHLRTPLPSSTTTPQPRVPCLMQPATHQQQQLPPILRRRGGAFHLEPAVVKASLTAVAELLISCGVGAFAARKGVLDRTVVSSLSKFVTPYVVFATSEQNRPKHLPSHTLPVCTQGCVQPASTGPALQQRRPDSVQPPPGQPPPAPRLRHHANRPVRRHFSWGQLGAAARPQIDQGPRDRCVCAHAWCSRVVKSTRAHRTQLKMTQNK